MVSPARKRTNPRESTSEGVADAARDAQIVDRLSAWFEREHRPLPFRQEKSAYRTWVSEIMLQQTQVKTVIPYFERWMKLFPTVAVLAKASEAEVLGAWQGLGYYSRGRNLHEAAKRIVADFDGAVPSDVQALQSLPGIGRYTAGAIASIAFDQPAAIVDGNVVRVLTRLDALGGDPRKPPLSAVLWGRAQTLVLQSDPARFNQGLMELGALVCTPTKPRCSLCPLLDHCHGFSRGLVEQLPELAKRPKTEVRRAVVFYAVRSGKVLLIQQPPDATHWARLFALPYVETKGSSEAARRRVALKWLLEHSPRAELKSDKPIAHIHYPITRFRFEAEVYAVRGVASNQPGSQYIPPSELEALALPAPHRKLLRQLAKV